MAKIIRLWSVDDEKNCIDKLSSRWSLRDFAVLDSAVTCTRAGSHDDRQTPCDLVELLEAQRDAHDRRTRRRDQLGKTPLGERLGVAPGGAPLQALTRQRNAGEEGR